MYLSSVKLQNYRIHKNLSLALEPGLNLITGPNESGKSTLVEAIRHGLFLRSKVTGALLEQMSVPGCEEAHVVELELVAGGQHMVVRKQFGARRFTSLKVDGEPEVTGDEADDKLAQLLGTEGAVGGKGAKNAVRWGYLWVTQGLSGQAPVDADAAEKQDLVKRLGRLGGTAVTQTPCDTELLKTLRQRYDAIFNARGNQYLVGSAVGKAQADLANAQAAAGKAQADFAAHEDLVRAFGNAANEVHDIEVTLATAKANLDQARIRKDRVDELNAKVAPLDAKAADAESRLTELAGHEASLKDLAEKLARVTKRLADRKAQDEAAAADLASAQTARDAASQKRGLARKAADAAQERSALLTKLAAAAASVQTLADLNKQLAKSKKLNADHEAAVKELAELPVINDDDLADLRRLAEKVTEARSARNALGARLRLVAGTAPVVVGGATLKKGGEQVITADTEITVGTTKLELRLGSGTGIDEANTKLAKAEAAFKKRLDELGCKDLTEAAGIVGNRTALAHRVEQLEEQQNELPEDLVEQIAEQKKQVRLAEEAAKESGAKDLPTGAKAVAAACRAAEHEAQAAKRAAAAADGAAEDAESTLDEARRANDKAQASARADQGERDKIVAERDSVLKIYGDDKARAAATAAAVKARDDAHRDGKVYRDELDELNAPAAADDYADAEQAVRQHESRLTAAKQARDTANGALTGSAGRIDYQAVCDRARAALAAAEAEFARQESAAATLRYLKEMAESLHEQIAKDLAKPLEARAADYLAAVFGRGAVVDLDGLREGGQITLVRGADRCPFEKLSGGTKEQVGIALRLAMAEVLAGLPESGEGLPVVLDDAFANSDPDRLRGIQPMLSLAARHGLQIILLTCSARDYASLAAHTVTLPPPVRAAV